MLQQSSIRQNGDHEWVASANEYRRHAEHCRQVAAAARVPYVRDDLLKMAVIWTRLAENAGLSLRQGNVPATRA
jgi:hypothetical protein